MHLKHKMAAAAIMAALAMAASSRVDATPRTPVKSGHTVYQGLLPTTLDCDPFADWDDDLGTGATGGGSSGTTNDNLLPGRAGSPARGRHATSAAAQVIGTTPEAIERNFIGVVTRNLANAGTASRVARLSDKELRAIARHAAQGAPAERAGLLKLFATRLDAPALVRIARAFGRAPTEAAVHAYASEGIRAAFENEEEGMAPPEPEGDSGSYPRPNLNMTLEEIYLEFRTAPVGSLSPSAALAETGAYAGAWLYLSWQVGTGLGEQIYYVMSTYAPDLDDALGGIIASMIDNMWLASSDIQDGHYEAALDELLGFPVTSSSDPSGDWDITMPMVEYYQWSATCGY
jgi:hypothetical protein